MQGKRVRPILLYNLSIYISAATDAKIDSLLEGQFAAGRLYASIASRPGQSGRADGYILEGKELEVSSRKLSNTWYFDHPFRSFTSGSSGPESKNMLNFFFLPNLCAVSTSKHHCTICTRSTNSLLPLCFSSYTAKFMPLGAMKRIATEIIRYIERTYM